MGSRRPWREARKASRPVASTRNRARRLRSPSPSLSRTVTPSASKATFSTVAGWSTRAPSVTAWSRRTWSNSARCTSKVKCGQGRPSRKVKVASRSSSWSWKVTPNLSRKPWALTLSSTPRRSRMRHAVGHQRLANLEAREDLALHHGDVEPAAGEKSGGGGAAGTAADHQDVGVVGHASITRCAARRRAGGTVIPRSRAVRKLRTSSKWVGCSMGRSAGRAPRSNRSA